MVDAQTIGVLVTASSVTVAAVYYMFTLRTNQRNYKATLETRQAQLFMQLFDRWTSSEFALSYGKARYEICPKLNNSPEELSRFIYQNTNESFNPEVFLPFHQLTLFFEGVGVLVQKGLVDIDLVERLFSDRIIWFWRMIKPRIVFSRESQGPQLYTNLEWLSDEMIRRQGKPAAP
jgi:hypothetical protein